MTRKLLTLLAGLALALSVGATSPVPFLGGGASAETASVLSGMIWEFDAASLSLTPTYGSGTPTLTRAGNTATRVDSAGNVEVINANLPRFDYNPSTLVLRGLLVEEARVNQVLQSTDLGTTWASVGTPTLSADATALGALNLDTLGDDDGAGLEGKTQTITFTANAVKVVSVFVKQGTATSSVVRLRDTSAPADRLLAAVTWSAGVPVVTMTTGTHEGTDAYQSGVFRIRFATTSVTAANTNSLQLYPATDAALATTATGTIQFGGMQAENALFSTSWIPTTTGTVTRAADAIALATSSITGFSASTLTLFAEAYTSVDASTTFLRLLSVDDGAASDNLLFLRRGSDGSSVFQVNDEAVTQVSATAGTPAAGVLIKWAGAAALNNFATSLNGGTVATDATGTMPTPTTVHIGVNAAGTGNFWNAPIRKVRLYNVRKPNTQLQQMTLSALDAANDPNFHGEDLRMVS